MGRLTALVSIGLLLAACGRRPGSTPEATFYAAKSALENQDGQAIYDLLCPAGQEAAVKELRTLQAQVTSGEGLQGPKLSKDQIGALMALKSGPAFLAWGMRNVPDFRTDAVASVRIVKTRISGDHAWITTTSSQGTGEFQMVRLKGKWYLFNRFPF